MTRSEKIYVGVDARSPPLIYRSYVVCRTVEREYYFVMAAQRSPAILESWKYHPVLPSVISVELPSVRFPVGARRRGCMLTKSLKK